MNFLDSIRSGVSLRKTSSNQQEKSTSSDSTIICSSDEDYVKLLEETNFDTYFKAIEPFTFKSLNMKLEMDEVKALVEENSNFKKAVERLLIENERDNLKEYDEWKMGEYSQVLNGLASRIDQKIKEMEQLTNRKGIFLRLSTLSPKDAAINRIGFVKLIHDEYLNILKESQLENDNSLSKEEKTNIIMYALYRASISILKIENGHQAVQLLIESKRAQQELNEMVKNSEKTPLDVIIREWNDFDVAHEFRAFVYNKQITGITQYNPVVFFPKLVRQKEYIKQLITSFVKDNILHNPLLPISNYAIDIILIKENPQLTDSSSHHFNSESSTTNEILSVKIVELNPLAEFTGTVLFSWEKDRNLLMAQHPEELNDQCDFRMLSEIEKFAEINSGPEWQQAIKKLHKYFL